MTDVARSAPRSGGSFSDLESVYNARDLGGTPTRSGRTVAGGRLFRSASIHAATPTDIARLRAAGVTEVVDLRRPSEVTEAGEVPDEFVVHHVPLVADADREASHDALRAGGLVALYRYLLDTAGGRLAHVVDLVSQARGGVLIQCAAGKDRTGLTVALLLSLLEADEAAIVDDYGRTRHDLRRIADRRRVLAGRDEVSANLPPEAFRADPQAMRTILQELRATRGGATAWLRSVGLSEIAIAGFRDADWTA